MVSYRPKLPAIRRLHPDQSHRPLLKGLLYSGAAIKRGEQGRQINEFGER